MRCVWDCWYVGGSGEVGEEVSEEGSEQEEMRMRMCVARMGICVELIVPPGSRHGWRGAHPCVIVTRWEVSSLTTSTWRLDHFSWSVHGGWWSHRGDKSRREQGNDHYATRSLCGRWVHSPQYCMRIMIDITMGLETLDGWWPCCFLLPWYSKVNRVPMVNMISCEDRDHVK